MRRFFPLMLITALCLALCGCGSDDPAAGSPPVAQVSAPVASDSPAPATPSPSAPAEEATPSPAPAGDETPAADVVVYSFGAPVEESEPVADEWFDDAVFLGDSRTEGFMLYSGLRTGDFLWAKGMNVFKAADRATLSVTVDGEEMSMLDALSRRQYGKVYIMMGINELGYATSVYEAGLLALIEEVRQLQPDAVIYLQTLPPVNETRAMESGLGSYVRNTKVNSFNEAIYRVAWSARVALLDVASIYRTEAGELSADMAVDGVHFYRSGYALWYQYLKSHTLDPASYENGAPLEQAIVPEVPDPPVVVWTSPSPDPGESVTPEPVESATPAPEETVTPEPTESIPPEEPVESVTPAPEEESPEVPDSPAPEEP